MAWRLLWLLRRARSWWTWALLLVMALSHRGGQQAERFLGGEGRDGVIEVGRVLLSDQAIAAVDLPQPAALRAGHHLAAAKNPVLTVA